jgi:aminoglycoside phosphotransferase (APT) family kinase protein
MKARLKQLKERLKHAISAASIRQIVKQHFGRDAQAVRFTPMRGGLFNTLYKLQLGDGRAVVLRIVPPQDKPLLACEAQLLEREIHFMRELEQYHLPMPRLLCADLSKRIIDRNYIISEFCAGHNAFYRLKKLTASEQDAVFGELGRYAKRIHAIENPAGWFGAPAPFKPFRKWSEFVRWHALTLEQELQGHSFMAIPHHIRVASILDQMAGVLDEIKTPRLVHGDLWLRNILIARRKGIYTISAILDWDRCIWGDPYFEWILHGLDLRPSFWQEYGPLDTDRRSHEKRKLLYKALGCLQASLEDSLHFHKRKQALQLLGYATANFTELSKAL